MRAKLAPMNRAQCQSLKKLYRRLGQMDPPRDEQTYRQFRQSVKWAYIDGCVMVFWCNMWIGIETDGYTHS